MNPATLPTHATLLHPRTGMPLQAVGHRADGRIIWPIIGGDGTEPDANDAAETPGTAGGEDSPPAATENPWEAMFAGQKPEDVKAALDNSRKWEQRSKANKEKADKFDSLATAITGTAGESASADDLTANLSAERQTSRDLRTENAVLRAALPHGANPIRLVDSMSFMAEVKKLDPSDDDFATKIADAVKIQVASDPHFRATPTPLPNPQQGNPSQGTRGGVQAGADMYHNERARFRGGSTDT